VVAPEKIQLIKRVALEMDEGYIKTQVLMRWPTRKDLENWLLANKPLCKIARRVITDVDLNSQYICGGDYCNIHVGYKNTIDVGGMSFVRCGKMSNIICGEESEIHAEKKSIVNCYSGGKLTGGEYCILIGDSYTIFKGGIGTTFICQLSSSQVNMVVTANSSNQSFVYDRYSNCWKRWTYDNS
jgi:hypothetical protein